MGLAHGALITMLVKKNKINLAPYKLGRMKVGTKLNISFFDKMHHKLKNGVWLKKKDQPMEQ